MNKTSYYSKVLGDKSLYKLCESISCLHYEFDLIKRLLRMYEKGTVKEDLIKSYRLLEIIEEEFIKGDMRAFQRDTLIFEIVPEWKELKERFIRKYKDGFDIFRVIEYTYAAIHYYDEYNSKMTAIRAAKQLLLVIGYNRGIEVDKEEVSNMVAKDSNIVELIDIIEKDRIKDTDSIIMPHDHFNKYARDKFGLFSYTAKEGDSIRVDSYILSDDSKLFILFVNNKPIEYSIHRNRKK